MELQNNCCECLNCKVKDGNVRCTKGIWSDGAGGTKYYGEYNNVGSHFYIRMYRSLRLLKIAKTCLSFVSMI